MENEKNCYNCGYFRQHYFRCDFQTYIPLHKCGHCSCTQICDSKFNKIIKKQLSCEFWYPIVEDIAKYKLSIVDKIDKMYKQLNCIASFLEENADIIPPKND